jgi:hypothetical protein
MHNITIQYVKKEGKLVPASEADAAKLKLYTMSLKEDVSVEVYLQMSNNVDKTAGQLAKVHALIRELAAATGHSFDEIKDEVKRKAGLYVITGTRPSDKELKSFGDCSKEEISAAIESCIEIGHVIGCNLY